MKVILSIVFLVFTVMIVQSRYVGPRNRRQATKCIESCRMLRECDPFLELLRTSGVKARRIIKNERCGRKGFRIMVCCPNTPSIQKSYFPYNCGNNPIAAELIYNGDETKMGEFPWIAALEYKEPLSDTTSVKCAGTLINARYVLTAAHCLDPRTLHAIRLGDWNLSKKVDCFESIRNGTKICAPPYIVARPEEIIPYPSYDGSYGRENDIGLIRLDLTIDFTRAKGYIMPICLPSFGIQVEFLKQNGDPIVIGWGVTEKSKSGSSILLKADVPFAERKQCQEYFSSFGEKQLCVGWDSRDSCDGDSGGPLMLAGPDGPPYLQIGIVSYGKNCGAPKIPAVYTSVQHYKTWISEQMKPWDV